MCPGPVRRSFRIASFGKELESSTTPVLSTGAETEKEIEASESAEDWDQKADVDFNANFILHDRELEQRLNYLVSKYCVQKVKKQPLQAEKSAIKPKQQQISEESAEEQLHNAADIKKSRLASALKSPTSPTSSLKKSVTFADSVGLNLEEIKLFTNQTDFRDDYFEFADNLLLSSRRQAHTFPVLSSHLTAFTKAEQQREMQIRWPLRGKGEVHKIVEAQNVCIESMSCSSMSTSGLVGVKNIAFEKQVQLRYTINAWETYSEIPCMFPFSSVFNNHYTFCFSFCLPLDLPVGSCCELCVCYTTAEQEFWDNNDSKNYRIPPQKEIHGGQIWGPRRPTDGGRLTSNPAIGKAPVQKPAHLKGPVRWRAIVHEIELRESTQASHCGQKLLSQHC
uniref:CBM21 domain-containing protein n=1 Tax=Plectus sambesii TaxID=2011161 RepID=A0A914UYI1_9BILA